MNGSYKLGTCLQLAASINNSIQLLDSDDYSIEQKLDGHRLMLIIQDSKIIPLNRNGEIRDIPTKLEALIRSIPVINIGRWIFDGELIKGKYFVFDMPEMNSITIAGLPWMQRRLALDKLFALLRDSGFDQLEFQTTSWTVENKKSFFDACLDKEGVMFKKIDSPYQPGRRSTWVKHKFHKSCEVIVTELNRKGKSEAMSLGLYDENGNLQNAGGCRILPKFEDKISVGDVVEIRYLYATKEFKLYQPHMMSIREDKKPEECGRWQLEMTNRQIV
jgi:ATP-dependent DNA ligase